MTDAFELLAPALLAALVVTQSVGGKEGSSSTGVSSASGRRSSRSACAHR